MNKTGLEAYRTKSVLLGMAHAIWIVGLLAAAFNLWMFLAFDAVSGEVSSFGDIGAWVVGVLALLAVVTRLLNKPLIAAAITFPQLFLAALTWLGALFGDFLS